jgi:glycosyltransferase involved in cell wall biosynthesis
MAQPTKLSSLSIFFPCFNEAANLKHLVTKALEIIPTLTRDFEIIIVNDGSTDNTLALASSLAAIDPHLRVVSHPKNQGYGAALKTGIAASNKEWIFFTDGDQQFDLSELSVFIPHTASHRVVIGYRPYRAEGFIRALNAKLFKRFIDILFRVHVKDIDCAFKLFHQDVIKPLPLMSSGAMISAEILYRLKKKKIDFKQIPVHHYPRRFGQPTG